MTPYAREDVPGQTEGTDPAPRISVVIPTHGRPDQLAACLEGLARATVPPGGFEVIVVDDGGPAAAAPALERFAGTLELRVIRQARNGPGAARNAGAAAARGQLLAFIDDDCVPSAGWLNALARQFGATPDAQLGGPVTNALPHNPFATASQLIASYTYRYYDRVPGAEVATHEQRVQRVLESARLAAGFFEERGAQAIGRAANQPVRQPFIHVLRTERPQPVMHDGVGWQPVDELANRGARRTGQRAERAHDEQPRAHARVANQSAQPLHRPCHRPARDCRKAARRASSAHAE